jgi:hypothetical protein
MGVVAGLLVTAGAGCAQVGYTDRVLHRVPSPDGQLTAVCQEVPVFDGPEFEVRLERPDGTVVRTLHSMGDAGGCEEIVWSADGRTLAVLTAHVAGITLIDIGGAQAHPQVQNRHWFIRGFSFSSETALRRGARLTFVSRDELEFDLCEYSLAEARRNGGEITCSQPARPQRLKVPTPLVPGARPETDAPESGMRGRRPVHACA